MKMIAKFSKTGDLKYCSHLDLQNLFMRAIARAKVPVKYSQGFNRHPNVSIAMALGVGQESISEYMDVELENKISEAVFMEEMNKALPKAVQIMGCRFVEEKFPAMMSLVYAAHYTVTFKDNTDITGDLKAKSDEILNQSAIMIEKKTKTKNELTDIRPMILDLDAKDNVVYCTLRCGQVNLKPKDLASLYGENLNYSIMRTSLLSLQENGELVELIEL